MGNVLQTEARDMYIAKAADLNAGTPQGSAALTLNGAEDRRMSVCSASGFQRQPAVIK
ncbi:hypothetical protein [Burkholderia multivorans]|uniref:hypothetical protein n=1 Tax=Burkholderia multivorans TaxID=87883 RepID=UPI00130DB0D9|nr:hypothetical protein [Burkholderia multivorans]MBU9147263.1 hypothetical protein [Burkholderia multivorans]MBU9539852.1 hypothetical protein [Burkholderia multivorans]MBU9640016.1 hypothetical protein [Burkholderia multivorans]HEF4774703.1 hypothetical protein [Burkholderia multivorans]